MEEYEDELLQEFDEWFEKQEAALRDHFKDGWLAILTTRAGFRREMRIQHPFPPRLDVPVPPKLTTFFVSEDDIAPTLFSALETLRFEVDTVDAKRSIVRYREV